MWRGVALVAVLVFSAGLTAQMQVVMLGTGTPVPDPQRSGPSLAVVANGQAYIVDAGPGVVRRSAEAAAKDSMPALRPVNLRVLFLTHLHSDHTAGLADLMLTPSVVGRDGGMDIYGPVGTADMLRHLREAYAKDIAIRTSDKPNSEREPASRYDFRVHEIQPGVVYKDANVTVTAVRVLHGNWDESLGYVFEDGSQRVVISGDTRPAETLVKACSGCDTLVHEVYSSAAMGPRGKDDHSYFESFHTSTTELADIATRAHAKKLVLTHVMYATPEAAAKEIRDAGYKGEIIAANDLDVIR